MRNLTEQLEPHLAALAVRDDSAAVAEVHRLAALSRSVQMARHAFYEFGMRNAIAAMRSDDYAAEGSRLMQQLKAELHGKPNEAKAVVVRAVLRDHWDR